jgi:hypothetical protein
METDAQLTSPGVSEMDERADRSDDRSRARSDFLRITYLFLVLDAVAVAVWWLTGAEGHFWPAWVILSSAVVIALRARPVLFSDGGHRPEH